MNDRLQEFNAHSGVGVIVLGKLMADLTQRLVKPSYPEQLCCGEATCLEGEQDTQWFNGSMVKKIAHFLIQQRVATPAKQPRHPGRPLRSGSSFATFKMGLYGPLIAALDNPARTCSAG